MSKVLSIYTNSSLVIRILVGIILGALVASISPSTGNAIAFLGGLFVSALKAVAPILIFTLVLSSLANQRQGQSSNLGGILVLYAIGTLSAATIAVSLSFLFPAQLSLVAGDLSRAAPQGILEVLNTLLFKIVDNPINALLTGNYVGILAWAIGLGLIMKTATQSSKDLLQDISSAVTGLVHVVIQFAPIGIWDWSPEPLLQQAFQSWLIMLIYWGF